MAGATGVERLLHVTTPAAWEAARQAGAVQAAPFLHLCTRAQLGFVLARHFAGRTGLLVLEVDPAGLNVRWEEGEPGVLFPHLYGALPASAVVGAAVA